MEKPILSVSNLRKMQVALTIAKVEVADDFFDEEIELIKTLIAHKFCEEHDRVVHDADLSIEYMQADDELRQASIMMINNYMDQYNLREILLNNLK